MGKIHEWVWSVGRWTDRSRWTFAAFYALVTFILLTIGIVVLNFLASAEDRLTVSGLLATLAIAAAVSVGFWSLMALGNAVAERRGTAITSRTTTEEAATLLARIPGSMSVRGSLILGLVVWGSWFAISYFGGGASLARSLTESLLLAGAVAVTWQFWRWAATTPDSGWLRRMLLAALAVATAWFVVSQFTEVLGSRPGTIRSLGQAGLTGVIYLGLGLSWRWIHRVALQSVTRAIRVRDRAQALARGHTPVDRAVPDVLSTSEGRRSALEWARSQLQRLPRDAATERALSLLEQAIRRTRGSGV